MIKTRQYSTYRCCFNFCGHCFNIKSTVILQNEKFKFEGKLSNTSKNVMFYVSKYQHKPFYLYNHGTGPETRSKLNKAS